ncbi:hypothetical protein chiPu_0030399, partial [Chiloscyllium punctatum]|nr:hypothetical protein [Chiloscyllium punctatum]
LSLSLSLSLARPPPNLVALSHPPASLQGDPKRITLVLQQPAGVNPSGPRHVMMRTLPGKILIQGQQITALAHSQGGKGLPGQPGKVVTIQLQLQSPQQKLQPCQMILQQQQQPVPVAGGQQAPAQAQAQAQPQAQQLQALSAQVVTQSPAIRQPQNTQRLTVPLQVTLQQVRHGGGGRGRGSGERADTRTRSLAHTHSLTHTYNRGDSARFEDHLQTAIHRHSSLAAHFGI